MARVAKFEVAPLIGYDHNTVKKYHRHTGRTDGAQTDGRTDDMQWHTRRRSNMARVKIISREKTCRVHGYKITHLVMPLRSSVL